MTLRRIDSVVAELLAKIAARIALEGEAPAKPNHRVNPDVPIGAGGHDDGLDRDQGTP